MARAVMMGSLGKQHPMFDISHANIAEQLTEGNWNEKTLVRIGSTDWLYLWIAEGRTTNADNQPITRFYVQVHCPQPGRSNYERSFDTLAAALAYANGEDGGALATETVPATPEQYPCPLGPDILVSSVPARRCKSE